MRLELLDYLRYSLAHSVIFSRTELPFPTGRAGKVGQQVTQAHAIVLLTVTDLGCHASGCRSGVSHLSSSCISVISQMFPYFQVFPSSQSKTKDFTLSFLMLLLSKAILFLWTTFLAPGPLFSILSIQVFFLTKQSVYKSTTLQLVFLFHVFLLTEGFRMC